MTRAASISPFLFASLAAASRLLAPGPARADMNDTSTQARALPTATSGAADVGGSPPSTGTTRPVGADSTDPPVDVLCKAAVRLALAEPDRARGFLDRARLAAWLPEIRFRIYKRLARTEGLSFSDSGPGVVAPVDISAIDDVRYEWRATWDLSRIVFNPDELQAQAEALRMSDLRRDIQSLVIRLYFERRRLMADHRTIRSTTDDEPLAEQRSLRIAEIEAELDALSAGAFSSAAARVGAVPGP